MKICICIFFLLLAHSIVYSQNNFDWEYLDAPDSSTLIVQYLSSQGYIFASDKNSSDFYISEDGGNTWNLIDIKNYETFPQKVFTEDFNGSIYFRSTNKLYKININNLNTVSSLLLTLSTDIC